MSAGNREYRSREGELIAAVRVTGANHTAACLFSGGQLSSKLVLDKTNPEDMALSRVHFTFRGEPISAGDWLVQTADGHIRVSDHRDFADNQLPVR